MPSHYKFGGAAPATCYAFPISPDLGNSPQGGPMQLQRDTAMVSASNPFQPCAPSTCPATSCCGGGAAGNNGPPVASSF